MTRVRVATASDLEYLVPQERVAVRGLSSTKRGDRATPLWAAWAVKNTWDLTIEVSDAIDRGGSQVQGDGIAMTVMLGLPGFEVLAVSEYAGELEQAVQTTAEQAGCGICRRRAGR